MVRKEEKEGDRRGLSGWSCRDGAAGEIHRRNFSDLLSSHLLLRRERRKEGELHYFFVVPSYVKFVGSFIHTGSSGLYIHLHTTSLPLFLFRHSLRRRERCEISKILLLRGVPYLSGSQCPHLARVDSRQIPRASQICQIRR